MILLFVELKSFFDKLYITKKNYQTVEKKQLLIILQLLGHLSFETRNRSNSRIRNQLLSCSLRIVQIVLLETRLSSLLKFKDSIPKYLRSRLTYKFLCSCCNVTYSETQRYSSYERLSIWESLH